MKIRAPYFAEEWQDEGILTFAAFALRVCEQYGYEQWYTMAAEDLSAIVNKRQSGLVDWLKLKGIGPIELGEPYNHTVMFKLPQPTNGTTERRISNIELTDLRQQKVWMYILGCLNHNLLSDKTPNTNAYRPNTWNISEFKITRHAEGYIKKSDRH
jgi:hypothetical protein